MPDAPTRAAPRLLDIGEHPLHANLLRTEDPASGSGARGTDRNPRARSALTVMHDTAAVSPETVVAPGHNDRMLLADLAALSRDVAATSARSRKIELIASALRAAAAELEMVR